MKLKIKKLAFLFLISLALHPSMGMAGKKKNKINPTISSSHHQLCRCDSRSPSRDPETEAEQIQRIIEECRAMTPAPQIDSDSTEFFLSPVEEKKYRLAQQLEIFHGRFGIWKFCKEFGKSALTGVGATAFSTWLTNQCAPTLLRISSESLTANQVSTAQQITTLSAAVASTLNAAWRAWENCTITEFEALRDMDLALRKEERESIRRLPEDLRGLVMQNYSELDQKYSQAAGQTHLVGGNEIRKLIFKRELFTLMMPYEPKDISSNNEFLDRERLAEIGREIEEILRDYPHNQSDLLVLVAQMRANSSRDLNPRHVTRIQKYLYGPPGTGKSSFVNRLAKALGLYVCRITSNDLANRDTLIGADHSVEGEDPKQIIGKLGQCYLEAGSTNFILFIDELGDIFKPNPEGRSEGESMAEGIKKQQILENLKLLLNQDQKSIEFKGLGANIDFSRVTVLAAGNHHLTDDAILRRMPEIRFLILSPIQKAIAFRNGYRSALNKLSIGSGLNRENLWAIKEVINRNIDHIMDQDKKFPGGGAVKQVLEEIFIYVSAQIQLGRTPNDEEVKREIDHFFQIQTTSLGSED